MSEETVQLNISAETSDETKASAVHADATQEQDLASVTKEAAKEEKPATELPIEELPLPDVEGNEEEPVQPRPKSKEERLLFKKQRELDRERIKAQELEHQLHLQQFKQSRQQQDSPAQDYSDVSRENFSNEEDWIAAITDKRLQQREEASRYQYQQMQHQKQQAEFVAKINEIKDKGVSKYSDFDDLVEPLFDPRGNFPRNEPMAAAIADSEFGDDILYFMGKYPDQARELAKKPPVQAIKAIAILEQRFREKRNSAPAKASEKLIEPLKGGKHVSPTTTLMSMTSEQIDRMSMKEFNERWGRENPKGTHY